MSDAAINAEVPVDTLHGDDLNVGAIALWGFVSIVVTAASILALHALYNSYADQEAVAKSYNAEYERAESELLDQDGALQQSVRWLDNDQTTVGVPIDRAMTIVVQEYQKAE